MLPDRPDRPVRVSGRARRLPRLAGTSKYGFLDRLGAGMFDLAGMFWLVRRGGYGVAREWDDPRNR